MLTVAKKNQKPFAVLLRAYRESASVTQATAAEAAGVHIQTYMRWERGETEPAYSQLLSLAALFGKTLNDFAPEGDAGG
jgi:DNA-binding XRE family transcriptional regulator